MRPLASCAYLLLSGLGLAAGLVLAAGLAGCGRADPDGHFGTTDRHGKDPRTFYVNNGSEPEYLDPGLASDSASSVLIEDLFEGLVVKHPKDLRPTQGVATHWEQSDDNTVFRFHLRPEARWSDGKPVVAEDFAYAWRRVLTAKTGARMATMLYVIKNGKLFNQGRLMRLSQAETLRETPTAKDGAKLSAGAAVRVIKMSPVTIEVNAATTPPAADTTFRYAKADDGNQYLTGGAKLARLSEPAAAEIVAVVSEAKCNGLPDHIYQLSLGDKTGYLPGCALKENKPKANWAVVSPHNDLPTFKPKAPETEKPKPETDPETEKPKPDKAPFGFIPASSLTADVNVLGIRASGDHVLEVELERPTPYFIELLGFPTLYPVRRDLVEHFEKIGRPDLWYRPENIITNGPYTLEDWQFRYQLSFKKNPHHYDKDKLKLDRIVWLMVQDYTATINLYATGELDYIGANLSLPSAHMDRLEKFKDFSRGPYLSTYWYEFNIDKEPVNDTRVRQALNLAIDKQLLIDSVTRADQWPATHYVPHFTGSGYAEQDAADKKAGKDPFAGKGHDFDPALARQLLAEAGYEVNKRDKGWHAEKFPALEILYNTSEGHRAIAVAVQDQWKRHLGVTAQLRNEEWKVMIKNLRDGHFQVARFGWVGDYNHPHTWMDTFLSYSANNWTHWADPKYDRMVERAASIADPVEGIKAYREAELLAVNAMARLPLYFYTKSTLIKPYVKGYWDNANNDHFFRWMWIDPNWRSNTNNEPSYPPREFPKPGRLAP